MTLSRNLKMALPLLAVIALFALWSIYWLVLSSQVRSRAEEALARGPVKLACAEKIWGGYPFRVEFQCKAPKLTVPGAAGEASFGASELNVVMQAWNFTHVIGLLDGPTSAELPGLVPLEVDHKRIAASLHVRSSTSVAAGLELPEAEIAGRFSLKAMTVNAEAGRGGTARLTAAAEAMTVTLPNGRYLTLKQLGLIASLPADVLMARDPLRYAAETGALITLERFDFAGAGFNLSLNGTATLDAQGLINGKLSATTADIDKLLAALEPALGVPAEQLSMARAAIMLTNANRTGAVTVNVVAERGQIKLGFFPIAAIKPLF